MPSLTHAAAQRRNRTLLERSHGQCFRRTTDAAHPAATGRPISIEQFHVVQLDEAGLGLPHWANVGEDQLRQQLLGTTV
jgi:hypothetical protein